MPQSKPDAADPRGEVEVMRLLAPAKINLHLRVGPPTIDGFHPLLTWMCTVSLFDTLTFSPAEAGGEGPLVALRCDDPALPCDQTNLVARCAAVLAEAIENDRSRTTREGGDAPVGSSVAQRAKLVRGTEGTAAGLKLGRCSAALQKRIPTGAGLGGGSSDGARAMLALDRRWGAHLGADRLAELSARCGSDLPFFFHGPSSVCTGRGQIVKPAPVPKAKWAVLVLPRMAMPTAAVYRRFDEMKLGDPTSLKRPLDVQAWAELPAAQLLPKLVNDLEAPAFALRPELAALRSAIESQLARPVRMSGSGSSLFTLFDGQTDARRAAEVVSAQRAVRALAVEVAPPIVDDLERGPVLNGSAGRR